MPSRDVPIHDRALFDALVAHMRVIEPELRIGSMFGCPAAFLGRRLAFCVFGAAIGIKVPAAEAARLIESGTATAFRRYGRPPMREWIEVQARPDDVPRLESILASTLRYARRVE
jgi:hypothetical protein